MIAPDVIQPSSEYSQQTKGASAIRVTDESIDGAILYPDEFHFVVTHRRGLKIGDSARYNEKDVARSIYQTYSSAMPLSANSFFAFSFLTRCIRPMPRSTLGALVNWILS